MQNPVVGRIVGRKRLLIKNAVIMSAIAACVFLSTGIVSGSSGEEAGYKGWVATDTYRVMNFAVLAVGLFILLRKPAAQAFNSRIQGIRDQLDELETKKKDAEKRLVEYEAKLSLLEGEAEKIIARYITQGDDAKKKIIKKAETA